MNGAIGNFASQFNEWIARPYKEDMSAIGWFWFFGLIVVISIAWAFIVRKIVD